MPKELSRRFEGWKPAPARRLNRSQAKFSIPVRSTWNVNPLKPESTLRFESQGSANLAPKNPRVTQPSRRSPEEPASLPDSHDQPQPRWPFASYRRPALRLRQSSGRQAYPQPAPHRPRHQFPANGLLPGGNWPSSLATPPTSHGSQAGKARSEFPENRHRPRNRGGT